jgi:LemA protein
MSTFYVLLAILAAAVFYGISIYNNLVRNKHLVDEGWSGIDTQLKRRSNLIPNLIETVKGYATHERTAFEEVTKLRTQAMSTTDIGERGHKEGQLTAALGRLFAVAEAYPDLKASQNFIDLQDDLSEIENEIQLARRYYNGTARNMNILVESFPSKIVANMFAFVTAKYFEIENPEDRAVPEVSFGD